MKQGSRLLWHWIVALVIIVMFDELHIAMLRSEFNILGAFIVSWVLVLCFHVCRVLSRA